MGLTAQMLGSTQELALLIHAATSALSQPAQSCANFALLSPDSSSTQLLPQPRAKGPQPSRAHPARSPKPVCTQSMSHTCHHPTLAQSQLQSHSYLALNKNIPRLKEPKGRFISTALSWCGSEGCHPHPAKRAGHHRLRPRPDRGHSATQGLFLAPVKKERTGAGGRQ